MALRVTIRNYKSIQNANIDLRPGLNVLIGPNGSGKTCLLSALKFLKDVFRVGAAQALARQGGSRRAYHRGQKEISFSFKYPYGERTYRRRRIQCQFFWEMKLSQAGPEGIATIIRERYEITGDYNGRVVSLFHVDIDRASNNRVKTKHSLSSPNEFGRDLFSSWQSHYPAKNKKDIADVFVDREIKETLKKLGKEPDRSCFPMLAALDEATSHIYSSFLFLNEYNILPDVARASTEQLPFAQMAPNGGGLSEVIDALENRRYHKLEQLRLIDMEEVYGHERFFYRYRPYHPMRGYPSMFLRQRKRGRQLLENALDEINKELSAAVRPVTNVSVEIDPTSGRRFVVFRAGDETFYPEEVSDGTVKWLCILVSLFVPFSRVYLLEEPENFLHPWMQQRLIAVMREQAKQNDTIFLLSSHSATILNAAYPEEILVVKQADNGTEISKMADVASIRDVLADSDFHLGDLWVSGAIGGVPTDE